MGAPDGKRGDDSYYNQLSSTHEQLPGLCPGDSSNCKETYASIIEVALSREALLLRMFKTRPDLKVAAAQQKIDGRGSSFASSFLWHFTVVNWKVEKLIACKLDVALFNHHLVHCHPLLLCFVLLMSFT